MAAIERSRALDFPGVGATFSLVSSLGADGPRPWTRGDAAAIAALMSLVVGWSLVAFRFGLEHTPDSGLYLYAGARGYRESLATATPSNYAPGFPWLISGALVLCAIPGDAATLVQALSLSAVALGSYLAVRATGASPIYAFGGAVFVALHDGTSYAFAIQLSEGPLCGALVLIAAVWMWMVRTRLPVLQLLLVPLASLAPLLKYAAAPVPLAVAASVALFAQGQATPLRRFTQFCLGAAFGLLPFGSYMVWNRSREGVLTAHPPARIGVWDNVVEASNTLIESMLGWRSLFLLFAAGVMASAVIQRRRVGSIELLFPGVIAIAYFGGLIAGASVVQVDPLSMRLCAPGIVMLVLALVIVGGAAIETISDAPARCHGRSLSAVGALLAIAVTTPSLRDVLANPLRMLAARQTTSEQSTFEGGFRHSESARSLRKFYAKELSRSSEISVTFLEAKRAPGHLRRGWMMTAGVLGNAPRRLVNLGKLRMVGLTDTSVRYQVGDDSRFILFLNADVSESRGLRAPAEQQEAALRSFIDETTQRVLDDARAAQRSEHWILIAKQARWFVPYTARLGRASVLREEDTAGYRAYLVNVL